MAKVRTVQVVRPPDYMVINESDFDPKVHQLFGATVESPKFHIVADLDGAKVYWDGDDFVSEPTNKFYASEDSAEGAIARTGAIQDAIESEVVTDVRPEVAQ